jgi:YggT family protein
MSDNILSLVQLFITVLTLAIIIRALMSWFDPTFNSAVGKIVLDVTEPIIRPIRQVIPSFGMIDISPIVAILVLQVLSRLLATAIG